MSRVRFVSFNVAFLWAMRSYSIRSFLVHGALDVTKLGMAAEESKFLRSSEDFVRKEEGGAGEIGLQRFVVIVAREDSIFPNQKVGITRSKLLPIL